MSYAFIKSLSQRPVQTYQELLLSMRKVLRAQYSQKPRLSSSHRLVRHDYVALCCSRLMGV